MKRIGTTVRALVCLFLTWPGCAVASVDLEDYRWRHRVLLIFATSPQTPDIENLRQVISQRRAAIVDRDMRVLFVFQGSGTELYGDVLEADDVISLRRRFGIGKGDRAVILVGKDGGEKLRAPLHEDLSTVFRLIDGMPMRQDEIDHKRRLGLPVTSP